MPGYVAACVSGDGILIGLASAFLVEHFSLVHAPAVADLATIGLIVIAFCGLLSVLNLNKAELVADFGRTARRLVRHKFVVLAAFAFAELALLPRLSFNTTPVSGQTALAIAGWYIAVWAMILVWRSVVAAVFRLCVKTGVICRKVVVVGATSAGAEFIEHMRSKAPGVEVVAVFDPNPNIDTDYAVAGVPIRGGIKELLNYHKHNDIDTVVLALPAEATAQTSRLVRQLSLQPLRVRLLPGSTVMALPEDWYAPQGELPAVQLLRITDLPIEQSGLVIKGLFDKVAAAIALFIFGPLMLACAIIIKATSPGPVFYKQPRVGIRNRTFQMYKFRSMHVHDGSDKSLTARNDRRIFPFGRIMRKLSFDELPQLLNVLVGDMSMVGPRPHMPEATAAGVLYHDIVPEYAARHRVKPGITGWAQVNGWRGPTETFEQLEKRVFHDLYYIENWSFFLDIKILIKTALVGFFGKNAF